ncbi:MAG TPA: TlyA family RNA methyltransferase [Vicinamibacterales bacterium]|nr:TlyA family RNA methyltransferase [Vicinamibacterales bacterium]
MKTRLDALLVTRGLAQSRERARALVLAGEVEVNGRPATKAGVSVDEGASITLRAPDHPWVGRGGLKLAHALEAFRIDVAGRHALDVGASTGGFTHVLLERGAARVVALDVGQGQLDWKLRQDPRVVVLEGVNARYLEPDQLPADLRRFDIVTIDVAFISLRLILPAVAPLVGDDGRVVALVKPQFEAGREEVGRGGIVRDPQVHERVVREVAESAYRVGLERVAIEPSPVTGAEGNREFFLQLAPTAGRRQPT